MPNQATLIIVLLSAIALLVLSARLHKNSHTPEDLLCGRRRVPALLCELSAAFNLVPPWLLVAVTLLAYHYGTTASGIAVTIWLGVVISFLWLAPKARQRALTAQQFTLARMIDAGNRAQKRVTIRRSVACISIICLCMSTGVQLSWLLHALMPLLDAPYWLLLACAIAVLLMSGLLGALWAAIVADATMAVLIMAIALTLVIAAALAPQAEASDASSIVQSSQLLWHWQVLLAASAVGTAFLISCSLAQPTALTHLLASRNDTQRLPWLGMAWALIMLSLALALGWLMRAQQLQPEFMSSLPTSLAWVLSKWFVAWWPVIAALLICIGIASQLSNCICMANHLAHDGIGAYENSWQTQSLTRYRWSLAMCLALLAGYCLLAAPLDTVWFGWHAMGAALGPLVFARLSNKPIRPGSTVGSIWAGFLLTLLFHVMPDTPGDILERGLPFVVAMGIALSGGDQRRNPDRADRGDRTVHDHLSI